MFSITLDSHKNSSAVIGPNTQKFIENAFRLNSKFLPQKEQTIATSSASPGYYDFGYYPYSTSHHHYHNCDTPKCNSSSSKSDSSSLGAFALALAVAGAFMLYFVGSELATYSDAKEDLEILDENYEQVKKETYHLNGNICADLENIFEKQQQILKLQKQDSAVRLIAKGTLLSGIGSSLYACAIGYFENQVPPLAMGTGLALMAAGSVVWIYKSGFESSSRKVQRLTDQLFDSLKNFKAAN